MDIYKVLRKLGIDRLNSMQEQTGKAFRSNDLDLVVLSPTGSGKTLAYLLPLAEALHANSDELQAVVIVPGRELAMQSSDVFQSMGTGLRAMALYGGKATMDEHRQLRKVMPHIVFATPGRMNDHIDKLNINAASVRWLVIDEFDKCLRMGFQNEMSHLLDRLPNIERRILLSATDAEAIPSFVRMSNCQRIDCLEHSEQTSERIGLFAVRSPERDKLGSLGKLLTSFGDASTIVFLNYRDGVERTANYLRNAGFAVSEFHGGLSQEQRETALYHFANASANILVGTDLASRGLDIPDVENIVHYNLPVGEEEYVHRTGRTGRWQDSGQAYFLLGPDETIPEYVKETVSEMALPDIEVKAPEPRMSTIYIGKGKKDKISKGDILGFLCKTGGLSGSDIGRIDIRERYVYAAVAKPMAANVVRRCTGAKIKGVKTVVELA